MMLLFCATSKAKTRMGVKCPGVILEEVGVGGQANAWPPSEIKIAMGMGTAGID